MAGASRSRASSVAPSADAGAAVVAVVRARVRVALGARPPRGARARAVDALAVEASSVLVDRRRRPPQSSTHSHRYPAHLPWPEHSRPFELGHDGDAQRGPVDPAAQRHSPWTQVPVAPQPPTHARSEQSAPAHPASHEHDAQRLAALPSTARSWRTAAGGGAATKMAPVRRREQRRAVRDRVDARACELGARADASRCTPAEPHPEAHAHDGWWKQRPSASTPTHPLTEQLGPWWRPAEAVAAMHLPWRASLAERAAHVGVAQSSPDQPASHAHVLPSTHAPRSQQLARGGASFTRRERLAAHAHVGRPPDGLWTQRPRNEQRSMCSGGSASQSARHRAPRMAALASRHTP